MRKSKSMRSKSMRVKRGGVPSCEDPMWTKGRYCPNHKVVPYPEKGPGYYHCNSCDCLSGRRINLSGNNY